MYNIKNKEEDSEMDPLSYFYQLYDCSLFCLNR